MHFKKQVTHSFITMTIAGAWICGRRMEVMDMVMLVLILVLGPVTRASAQTTCSQYYDVGGYGQPWNIPTNPDFYQSWASGIQFLPGDCIWFNRVTDGYVDEVSAQDYNSCTITSPLAYAFGYGNYGLPVGPFPVTQTYPQSYHFIEADAANCTAGMKFYVTVVDPLSVPSPPPTSVNAPTPPPTTPPISPPGPPTTPTPPLVGEATPTKGNGTSSKLSPGAIAAIAIAAIASALGVGGIAVRMNMALNCCPTFKICDHPTSDSSKPGANDPVQAQNTKTAYQKPVMSGP